MAPICTSNMKNNVGSQRKIGRSDLPVSKSHIIQETMWHGSVIPNFPMNGREDVTVPELWSNVEEEVLLAAGAPVEGRRVLVVVGRVGLQCKTWEEMS